MRRVRHHVNPLKIDYLHCRPPSMLELPRRGPVEVELGCADAQFLFQRARQHAETLFVGLEIRADFIADIAARARAEGLTNLRAAFAHINVHLEALFPNDRLRRAFFNFPDPWFKRRHHKRRALTPEVAALLLRKLEAGGELLFQSDVFGLALDAMSVLEQTEGFSNRAGEWSFLPGDHGFGARSQREEWCLEKGLKIWRLLYERSSRISVATSTGEP